MEGFLEEVACAWSDMEVRNQLSGGRYASKREQNVQRSRDRKKRMTGGAAESSAGNGGHTPEAWGVDSRLQMCL